MCVLIGMVSPWMSASYFLKCAERERAQLDKTQKGALSERGPVKTRPQCSDDFPVCSGSPVCCWQASRASVLMPPAVFCSVV